MLVRQPAWLMGTHGLREGPYISVCPDPSVGHSLPLGRTPSGHHRRSLCKTLAIPADFDSTVCGAHNFPKGKDLEHYAELQRLLDCIPHRAGHFDPVKWDGRLTDLRNASYTDKEERNVLLTEHAQILNKQNLPYFLPAPHI